MEFDSKPVYGEDYKNIKTKIKIYVGGIVTDFHNRKILKEKSPCNCLSIIMLDSVTKAKKRYYPKTLEECKYEQERIKIENLIDDDLVKSDSNSHSNDETESDIDNDESNK